MVATGKLSATPTRQRPTSSLGLTPSWPKAISASGLADRERRRSVSIVLPPTRSNLRKAFDVLSSAAEPHMNVLAFHSERRCEILDGNTLVTCLLERCQDSIFQRSG